MESVLCSPIKLGDPLLNHIHNPCKKAGVGGGGGGVLPAGGQLPLGEDGRTTAAAAAAAATVIRGVVTSPSIFPATKNVPPFTLAHTQHMLSTDNFAAVKY